MKLFFKKKSRIACSVLALFCLFALALGLSGCVTHNCMRAKHSERYLNGREEGLYPTQSDFPYTKWTCRELDLSFNLYHTFETYFTGNYVVDGKQYNLLGQFSNEYIRFAFYDPEQPRDPKDYYDALTYRNSSTFGTLRVYYEYQKDTGVLLCSEIDYEADDGGTVPETLTFEQTGQIDQSPKTRWVADEIDWYFDSFSDADGYYEGEIVVDGVRFRIWAIEVGNGGLYELDSRKIDDWTDGYSFFPDMFFEFFDDRIVATLAYPVSWRGSNRLWYKYYRDVETVTFRPAPTE